MVIFILIGHLKFEVEKCLTLLNSNLHKTLFFHVQTLIMGNRNGAGKQLTKAQHSYESLYVKKQSFVQSWVG